MLVSSMNALSSQQPAITHTAVSVWEYRGPLGCKERERDRESCCLVSCCGLWSHRPAHRWGLSDAMSSQDDDRASHVWVVTLSPSYLPNWQHYHTWVKVRNWTTKQEMQRYWKETRCLLTWHFNDDTWPMLSLTVSKLLIYVKLPLIQSEVNAYKQPANMSYWPAGEGEHRRSSCPVKQGHCPALHRGKSGLRCPATPSLLRRYLASCV